MIILVFNSRGSVEQLQQLPFVVHIVDSLSFFQIHHHLIDNDSEDEGTSKTKPEKKVAEPAEVAEEQEDDSGEIADGAADDEDDGGDEDGEVSGQVGGVDSGSEREGRQNQSASMSSRSESKPYSSVTHKCEVRHTSLCKYIYNF